MRIIIRRWFRNIFTSSCKSWAFWLSKFFFCLNGASSEDTNDDCKIALIIYLFEAGLVSLGCLIMLKVYNDYKTPCHGAKIKSGCWRQKINTPKAFSNTTFNLYKKNKHVRQFKVAIDLLRNWHTAKHPVCATYTSSHNI